MCNYDYAHFLKTQDSKFFFAENLSIYQGNLHDAFMIFKSQLISAGVSDSPNPLLLGGDFRYFLFR